MFKNIFAVQNKIVKIRKFKCIWQFMFSYSLMLCIIEVIVPEKNNYRAKVFVTSPYYIKVSCAVQQWFGDTRTVTEL